MYCCSTDVAGETDCPEPRLKEATVKRYHFGTREQLERHLQLFVDAYKHVRRLKSAVRPHSLYEFVCGSWTKQPGAITVNPLDHALGPNI